MDSYYDSSVDAMLAGRYYSWKLDRNLFSGEVYFRGAEDSRSGNYDALLMNPEGPMEEESLRVKFVSLKTIKQRVREANRNQAPPGVINSFIQKAYKHIPDDILLIGVSKPDGTTDNNILSFVRGMYKACIVTREKEEEYNKKYGIEE